MMDYIFDGVPNFRDMGGIETKNGRTVKHGLLFRSGELSAMSERDKDVFKNDLHIKTIIDYRDTDEVELYPSPALEGVNDIHIPANTAIINVSSMQFMTEANLLEHFSLKMFGDFYKKLPVNNPAYKELVKQLQTGGQPLLQHCTAGKDRTGIGAFIVYLILDVPINTIVHEFLKTNEYFEKNPPHWFNDIKDKITDPEVLAVITGVRPDYMFYAYDEILNNYDTIADYLYETYNIDAVERKRIQDIYLD